MFPADKKSVISLNLGKIILNQFHDVIEPGRMAYQDLIRISFQPYYAKLS